MMKPNRKRWYWFLGIERWDGGYQIGLGIATANYLEIAGWHWWWNRD